MTMTEMLPNFPDFQPVTAADYNVFQEIISQHDPYSDFNFVSFYTWNTQDKHQVTVLHGNIVLQLSDYITGNPVFSVLGTKNMDETIEELLTYSENIEHATMKLIPNTTKRALSTKASFTVTEDPDNFDYLFSIPDLATLSGNKFKNKRQAAQKCRNQSPDLQITTCNPSDSAIQEQITHLLTIWKQEKDADEEEVEAERLAINRLLQQPLLHDRIELTGAFLDDKLVGFSVDELLPKQHVLSHYFKTHPKHYGLGELLNQSVAARLHEAGYTHWNWEQDLGIDGLKNMKRGYRPIGHLKKYIINK